MNGPRVPWWWNAVGIIGAVISGLAFTGMVYVTWHFVGKYW